jgi:hypothetical protein
MISYLLKLLVSSKRARRRIMYERLTEPLHMNLLSMFVLIFCKYRTKIDYDLIIRHQYAFGILEVADAAKARNIKTVKLIEFGVGHGAGLLKMQDISRKVSKITGINFEIFGFDIVTGMPTVKSFKDNPEDFSSGIYKTDH